MKKRILKILARHKGPHITRREIARKLKLSAEDKSAFRQAVRELVDEGVLIRLKKNYYALRGQSDTVTGKIQAHRAGFGFLIPDPECGLEGDVYISAGNLGYATHGDRAVVELIDTPWPKQPRKGQRPHPTPARHKQEGRVIKVLERGKTRIVGKILFLKRPVVIPLDSRYHYTINITNADEFSLEDNDVVYAELTSEPTPHTRPLGRILALVGKDGDPDLPFKITIHKHEIPVEFPPAVLAEAEAIDQAITTEEIGRRMDFRDQATVTIDGETAFDFDDAVYVERTADGHFTLWVHIADVSHYVRPLGALDQEAYRRGTSVYFPDRAISMLPERLSSNICSLVPDQDRLSFTAILTIHGQSGKTMAARFSPSVIRSRARMTYTRVAAILDGDPELRREYESLVPQFELMGDLARLLNERRRRRGAIDFDLPEEEIRFDQMENVIGIYKAERTFAHRLIEEFMLAANEAVATFFDSGEIPGLFRIHEQPDPLKVQEFAEIAHRFGYDFDADGDEFHPRDFQKIADDFEDTPVGKYLTYVMLRSFKLAVYSDRNLGHFGLAATHYTHFTSPIRRYPDLVVHRILRWALAKRRVGDKGTRLIDNLAAIAQQSSEREREAVEAEREILAWKKAQFMDQHREELFEGFVSGIRPQGFHVELVEYFVEGFVNLASLLDDYYVFDEENHLFMGERTGRIFRLGTPVEVRVTRVDMERYLIDFTVERTLDKPQPPGPTPARQKNDRSPRQKSRGSSRQTQKEDAPARSARRKSSRKKSDSPAAGSKNRRSGSPSKRRRDHR